MPREKSAEYYAYLLRTGVPDCQRTPGNGGVYALRRHVGDATHFLLISLWESFEALRVFSADPIDGTRYFPDEAAYLLAMEPTIVLYDVLLQPALPAR